MSQTLLAPSQNKNTRAVTAKTASFTFYDIECLNNVFTLCAYSPRTNSVDVFYLVDDTENSSLSAELRTSPFDTPSDRGRVTSRSRVDWPWWYCISTKRRSSGPKWQSIPSGGGARIVRPSGATQSSR